MSDAQREPPVGSPPVLRWGLLGALLLWLAQPPAGCWPLAWAAPIPWLVLCRDPALFTRSHYLRVWLAGCVYWLLAVHWVRLPHPLTPIGWLFLSAYLGCYPLAFVGLTRAALRMRAPLWIAAPVAWTGLEFLQANFLSGFLMGALGHSQAGVALLLPIASVVGAYGVSFVVMLAAAAGGFLGGGAATPSAVSSATSSAMSLGARSLGLIALATLIGLAGSRATDSDATGDTLTVAVIQGDTRATWDHDHNERNRQIMERQTRLSLQAVQQAAAARKSLDLIVWPESMFRASLETFAGSPTPPEGVNDNLARSSDNTRSWFLSLATQLKTPLLVGIDRFDWRPDPDDPEGGAEVDFYNSAALVDADGRLQTTYDKTHLVPFGEYIPLAKGMPALYFLTPMSSGMASGAGPVAMRVDRPGGAPVTVSPSICYETVVPHVIRRHVAELTGRGEAPHLMVNVTNDAWFWGSSELDMHLACAVFRAVETGTPLVVAANGGLSAVIDASGRVFAKGPRMEEHVLIAEVPLRRPGPPTPYLRFGDWFAIGCLLLCGGVAVRPATGRLLRRWRGATRGGSAGTGGTASAG